MSYGHRKSQFTVADVLTTLSGSLDNEIANRKYFYRDARLVKDGIIHLQNSALSTDLTSSSVDIDRRMVDFLCGLDTEVQHLLEGSHLRWAVTRRLPQPPRSTRRFYIPTRSRELTLTKFVKLWRTYCHFLRKL